MKKLKKFFGVFAVALLLMSMSSNITNEELKKVSCWDAAVAAEDAYNNYMVNHNAIPTNEQSFNVFSAAYDSCEDLMN